MLLRLSVFIALFACSGVLHAADVLAGRIPPANTWESAGVSGSLPTGGGYAVVDVTQAPYSVDNTGASSAVSGINSAIAAQSATANAIIYLPTGTYKIDGQITIAKSNLILRGDGGTLTQLVMSGSSARIYGGNSSAWSGNSEAITGGDYAVGATVLTVADTTGFSAGQMARVWQENDQTIPVLDVVHNDLMQAQIVKVDSVGAGSITVTPAVVFPLTATLNPAIFFNSTIKSGIGIENLYLNAAARTGSTELIQMNCTMGSWVQGVRFYQASGYNLYFNYAFRCEVRKNYFDEIQNPQPNNAGVKCDTVGSCLIVDNIFVKQFPGVQINGQPVTARANNYVGGGSAANVIAYNYFINTPNVAGSGNIGYNIITCHGSWNTFNLYEGNIGCKLVQDGFYGGASQDTIVRNFMSGVDTIETNLGECLVLGRFTRSASAVGNVWGDNAYSYTVTATASGGSLATRYIYRLGYPQAGNRDFTGTAEFSTADPWADYGTAAGSGGFQEHDLDVANTLLLKGNYNTQDDAVPAGEALAGATISNSYFLASKPAWFYTLTWPNVEASTGTVTSNPAKYRYDNGGVDPPSTNLPPASARRNPAALGVGF